MDERDQHILRLLHTAGLDYVSTASLAAMTGLSTRTVIRRLEKLETESQAKGFQLEKNRQKGYRLRVLDSRSFDLFWRELVKKSAHSDVVFEIALSLLLDGSVRLDDLAEKQNYSRSSLSRMLSEVTAFLALYGLALESKAYKGLIVVGNEMAIRAAIAKLAFSECSAEQLKGRFALPDFDMDAVLSCVEAAREKHGYRKEEQAARNFLSYLMLCAARMKNGCAVDWEPEDVVLHESSMEAVTEVLSGIPALFPEAPASSEIRYLSLAFEHAYLSTLQFRQSYRDHPGFYQKHVIEALGRINVNYHKDFFDDPLLVGELSEQLAASGHRYLLGIDTEAPYAEMVQIRFPMARYFALELAEVISRETKMPVLPGELGLLTMHIAASLERTEHPKKRVALLYRSEFGSASLLKSRLQREYEDLEIVGAYGMEEAEALPPSVDIYLVTAPMEGGVLNGKPVIALSPLLGEDDRRTLDAALRSLHPPVAFKSFFSEDCFFVVERQMKKEAALQTLLDALVTRGRISLADKAAVLAREALASTEVVPSVVMPHCFIQGTSFLAFAVLKTPIPWEKTKARLVLLGFFQKGDERIKHLLPQLYRVLEYEDNVMSLAESGSYQEFSKKLQAIMGKR